jgi:hypothetical protein
MLTDHRARLDRNQKSNSPGGLVPVAFSDTANGNTTGTAVDNRDAAEMMNMFAGVVTCVSVPMLSLIPSGSGDNRNCASFTKTLPVNSAHRFQSPGAIVNDTIADCD